MLVPRPVTSSSASPGSACSTSSTSCRRRRSPSSVRRRPGRGAAQDHLAGPVVVPVGGAGHVPVRPPHHLRAGRWSGDALLQRRSDGTAILTGMLFGITMFLNVWGVIWRNQKIVIGSAEAVADGGEADPRATPGWPRSAARAVADQHLLLVHHAVVHGVRRPRRRLLVHRRHGDRRHDRLLALRAHPVGLRRGAAASASSAASTARSTSWPSTTTRRRSPTASSTSPSSTSSAGSCSSRPDRVAPPSPSLDGEGALHAGAAVAGDVAVVGVLAGLEGRCEPLSSSPEPAIDSLRSSSRSSTTRVCGIEPSFTRARVTSPAAALMASGSNASASVPSTSTAPSGHVAATAAVVATAAR